MNIKLLLARAAETVHRQGLRGVFSTAYSYLRASREDQFDEAHSTDTSGRVPLWKFQVGSANARYGLRYEASCQQDFASVMKLVHEDFHTFTFIDLGCGKGRTLVLASKLGFKAVVGVEFVSELAEIAKTNLAKLGIQGVTVLHVDAAEFSFPEGNLLIYLFNPFTEEVMQRVIANLHKCSQQRRKLYVVYNNPMSAAVFDSSGFLTRFGHTLVGRYELAIWRSNE